MDGLTKKYIYFMLKEYEKELVEAKKYNDEIRALDPTKLDPDMWIPYANADIEIVINGGRVCIWDYNGTPIRSMWKGIEDPTNPPKIRTPCSQSPPLDQIPLFAEVDDYLSLTYGICFEKDYLTHVPDFKKPVIYEID